MCEDSNPNYGEATPEMIEAGKDCLERLSPHASSFDLVAEVYRAMVLAKKRPRHSVPDTLENS
jgi:hypothetical protein